MFKQVEFKSIDFGQLLRATEGLTQLRSMGLMFLTLLVSGLLFGLGVRLGMLGILLLGLLAAVVSIAGTAAVGVMLLDRAKNQEPRSIKDAFLAGLNCVPKIMLYVLLVVALFVALSVVAAILYYICKIPFIGPVLLFFVHPALVLLAASLFIVLFWLVAPILMPALWDGRSLKAGIGLVLAVARERLIQVVVMVLILYMLLGVVYLVVSSGFIPGFMMMSGLAGGITGGSNMMMGAGGFGGMGSSMGGSSGSVLALAASSLVIISVVMALLMQVMFMGYSLIYLMATEGLDEHGTEASLQAGIAAAREKARQAQEMAREAAEKIRSAVPAPSASPTASAAAPATDPSSVDIFAPQTAPASAPVMPSTASHGAVKAPTTASAPVQASAAPVVGAAVGVAAASVATAASANAPVTPPAPVPPAAPVVAAPVVTEVPAVPVASVPPVAAPEEQTPSAPMQPRCSACFEVINAGDVFCEHCGHKQR